MSNLKEISKEEFLELRKECVSDAELAGKLNCSRQYINHMRKIFGISSRRKDMASRDEKIYLDSIAKVKRTTMSRKYKLSVCQIYRIIKKVEESWKKKN